MKAIMLMFDSLNRHMLETYGCDWTHTPNFRRLAERTTTFDNCYVGSLPCMPARRELQTGRYNFLHRSWGPMEPFDVSMPELLRANGVRTHLITDHYHYWEDGGATYHTRFRSCELVRGQEGEGWKTNLVDQCAMPDDMNHHGEWGTQDQVNRSYIQSEDDFPMAQTFRLGREFLETNRDADNWFLQLETFDPHEPFHAPERFREMFKHEYDGEFWDWPYYGRVPDDPQVVEHMRMEYAALLAFCDEQLGKVLDLMDTLDLWKDTMLIVNTDHGFMLGEKGWWAKCVMPWYNEKANTPLFVWDPRHGKGGERRESLVQTIDIAPTVLEYFGVERPAEMLGRPLAATVADDTPVREAGLYGNFGGYINITDGRYVYMRAPDSEKPLYNHTLMPTNMRGFFSHETLKTVELAEPFAFTQGLKTMRTEANPFARQQAEGHLLFDLDTDPQQENPISDAAVEERMCVLMAQLMRENDAPRELYERMGLPIEE